MWVRRSSKEQIKVRFKWKSFLLFFLLVFILKFFGDYLFGEGRTAYVSPPTKPMQLTFQECISRIPAYTVLSLFIGFFGALVLLSSDKWEVKKNSRKYYCLKCGKMQINPNQSHCKCGGEFVNLNLLKWVEMPEELTEANNSSLN